MIKLRLYDGQILKADMAKFVQNGLLLDESVLIPYNDIMVLWGRSGEVSE